MHLNHLPAWHQSWTEARFLSTVVCCRRNGKVIEQYREPKQGSEPLSFGSVYAQPFTTQYVVLLTRFLRSFWRNPTVSEAACWLVQRSAYHCDQL